MVVFGDKSRIGYYKVLFWKKLFSINKIICCCLTKSILVKNINFEVIYWFSDIYTCFGLQKYQFWRNQWVFRNIYQFRITKISILKKYIGFQKYIPVSDYKNINFEEIHGFQSFGLHINIEEIHLVFIYIYTKISILKKYTGFHIYIYIYIPVSDYKNINFEEIHWFPAIHTCFGWQHLLFNKAFRKIYLHGQPIIFKSMLQCILYFSCKKTLLLFNQLLLQRLPSSV